MESNLAESLNFGKGLITFNLFLSGLILLLSVVYGIRKKNRGEPYKNVLMLGLGLAIVVFLLVSFISYIIVVGAVYENV